MLFELDIRLNEEIRNDLVKRVCQLDAFKGVVLNAQYLSNGITENEWKNDFAIPPHLEAGSLTKYRAQHGTTDALRDSYGLLTNQGTAFKV